MARNHAMSHDALIIGGGVGGLAAAVAFHRHGLEPLVCERDPALADGAGVLLPPNAMRVLARLGLADAARDAGVRIDRTEIRDHLGHRLRTIDLAAADGRHGAPTIALARARLNDLLREALPAHALRLGARCIDVAHRGDGVAGSVEARFDDGTTERGALLVGADGVQSVVREQVAASARPRAARRIAYRGIARLRVAEAERHTAVETWGPGWRVGHAPIGDDARYWFATLDVPNEDTLPAPARALLDATDPAAVRRDALADLAPLPRWHVGRIVLLGDAAHASSPNVVEGGAEAMEDAWALAARLAPVHGDGATAIERALLGYEQEQAARAARVVRQSRRVGWAAHLANPIGREVRNVLMRMGPTAVVRSLDRVYTPERRP